MFLLLSLVTGLSSIWISLMVPKLWKLSFVRDWPEIRKLEIPTPHFCPISGDWGKLRMQNLARIFLTKIHWMLQKARITAFPSQTTVRKSYQDWQVKTKSETWLGKMRLWYNTNTWSNFLNTHQSFSIIWTSFWNTCSNF